MKSTNLRRSDIFLFELYLAISSDNHLRCQFSFFGILISQYASRRAGQTSQITGQSSQITDQIRPITGQTSQITGKTSQTT